MATAAVGLVDARAGFVMGQRALLYGELGLGRVLGVATTLFAAGIGVEFGLNTNLSASFEFKGLSGLDGAPFFDLYMFQWSLNWHP